LAMDRQNSPLNMLDMLAGFLKSRPTDAPNSRQKTLGSSGTTPTLTIPQIYPAIYHENMTLIVYTAPWCSDCREAKRFLLRHNIPYTEIDVETTPGAAQELIAHVGKRAIPQFVIDGRWVQPYQPEEGFLYQEMSELLGLAQPSESGTATQGIAPRGPRS